MTDRREFEAYLARTAWAPRGLPRGEGLTQPDQLATGLGWWLFGALTFGLASAVWWLL